MYDPKDLCHTQQMLHKFKKQRVVQHPPTIQAEPQEVLDDGQSEETQSPVSPKKLFLRAATLQPLSPDSAVKRKSNQLQTLSLIECRDDDSPNRCR